MAAMAIDPAQGMPTRSFRDAAPLLGDHEALRRQAERDGYLFMKNVVPRDVILELRRQILTVLDRRGWMDPSRPLLEGTVDSAAIHAALTGDDVAWNGVGVPQPVYREIQKLEAFHALAHEPGLLQLYEALFDARPFPHPRHIARVMLPHRELKRTPSHQDYIHIQGAPRTWTCWIPLGDAPVDAGPLAILEGSHRAGLLGVTEAPGAGGLEAILCGLGYEWAAGDYEIGDLVTFHSYTVHKALQNDRKDRIRLSADIRYQPANEPIETKSLLPHGPFEWEDLYEGWTREDLKYYWSGQTFEIRPFDETIRWQKEKIC